MIYTSLRNEKKRKEIENKLTKNKWNFISSFNGLRDKDILKLNNGDIIIGYLSLGQMFLPQVDVELWTPTNFIDTFDKYLLTAIDLEGEKNCVIFLGKEKI